MEWDVDNWARVPSGTSSHLAQVPAFWLHGKVQEPFLLHLPVLESSHCSLSYQSTTHAESYRIL